ncbi:MAG: BON domain-containing protein [Chromatiaceae bacterium]|nr:BON domain-containing protein [Chromatiaceae bacterium]
MIDDGLIDVSLQDGAVTLMGTVSSLEEKRLAESLARVLGVRSVDTSGLDVQWWADEAALRDSKYVWKSDADIRTAIKDAVLYDPRLLSFPIEPDVSEGWVTLRGTVDNLEAKRAAARVARNTVGVFGVTNRLKVRPPSDLSDEVIAADIRGRLLVSPITESNGITVMVHGGKAILEGTVASYLERMEAERLASKAAGVTRVSNRLRVDYEPASREPYHGSDFPMRSAIIDRMPPGRTDREIHDEIHEELVWSPFVDVEQVNIDVADGRVTLTGTVETWREYYAAEENAYEGGALIVSNRLEVK